MRLLLGHGLLTLSLQPATPRTPHPYRWGGPDFEISYGTEVAAAVAERGGGGLESTIIAPACRTRPTEGGPGDEKTVRRAGAVRPRSVARGGSWGARDAQ